MSLRDDFRLMLQQLAPAELVKHGLGIWTDYRRAESRTSKERYWMQYCDVVYECGRRGRMDLVEQMRQELKEQRRRQLMDNPTRS